jgi:hypothetical protein
MIARRYACHELRNPLHAIMAMLDFLTQGWSTMTSEQRSDLGAIQHCAFNMQRLVNDVLDLAKLREGALALHPVAVGARALVGTGQLCLSGCTHPPRTPSSSTLPVRPTHTRVRVSERACKRSFRARVSAIIIFVPLCAVLCARRRYVIL